MATGREERLLKLMPITECGEKLVRLRSGMHGMLIEMEETSRRAQRIPASSCYVRKSVAMMLFRVQSSLPIGMRLKIIDGFRPLTAQKRIYMDYVRRIKRGRSLSDAQARRITNRWVSNPWTGVPPHSTGGTVDLTIVDGKGDELGMGSEINSVSEKSITNSRKISKEERRNRMILVRSMERAGFVNYSQEWWHWSYGDRRWAVAKRKSSSIYGPLR